MLVIFSYSEEHIILEIVIVEIDVKIQIGFYIAKKWQIQFFVITDKTIVDYSD